MKGFAIGFSESSIQILEGLKKTEFVQDIYRASSIKLNENKNIEIPNIDIKKFLKEKWEYCDLFIFVGSIAASVRLIAPFLKAKDQDPGIIVIDQDCSKIIPLIGSHQSRTMNIALQISNLYGGEVIDTSNSINEDLLALDSFGLDWGWKRSGSKEDWSKLVILQSRKEKIFFDQSAGNTLWSKSESGKKLLEFDNKLNQISSDNKFFISVFNQNQTAWHPPTLWIGIGCERNTSKQFIEEALLNFLNQEGLSPLSIAGLATAEIKKDEIALLAISKENKWPIMFFSSKELCKIKVPNPSEIVLREIGSGSVAEAASILAAGKGGRLIREKKVFQSKNYSNHFSGAVTFAIAESNYQYAPSRGEVNVIGAGPGDISLLTSSAKKTLSKCPVWIGYKLYLDLLQDLKRTDQVIIDSELTKEKQRCEKAISLASQGIKVALISSGDAGIYGMAGLLLELLQEIKRPLRPAFRIHPGISSMHLASSLAGAPLMNDFCSISLSDKLTPWKTIENRIRGALAGDFVVVIFNPRSQKRDWQLQRTIDLFLEIRDINTPVLLARQVGREDQTKSFFTLGTIPIQDVDMFSLLIVGNSKSSLIDDIFVTPRGYL